MHQERPQYLQQPTEPTSDTVDQADSALPKPLTDHELSKLFFLSFRHSQGSPDLQQWLLDYVRVEHGQQLLASEQEKSLRADLLNTLKAYLRLGESENSSAPYHVPVDRRALQTEVNRTVTFWKQSNQRLHHYEKPYVVHETTTEMLGRDALYFIKEGGRPRTAAQHDRSPVHSDRYFSFVLYYGLEGHPTGLKVLDHLYRDARALIEHSAAVNQGIEAARLPEKWLLSDNALDNLTRIISRQNYCPR